MAATKPVLVLAFAIACAACGSSDDEKREAEEPVMKPEETVFREYVTAPGKVKARTDAAMDVHRKALESQIEASEAPPEAEPEPEE